MLFAHLKRILSLAPAGSERRPVRIHSRGNSTKRAEAHQAGRTARRRKSSWRALRECGVACVRVASLASAQCVTGAALDRASGNQGLDPTQNRAVTACLSLISDLCNNIGPTENRASSAAGSGRWGKGQRRSTTSMACLCRILFPQHQHQRLAEFLIVAIPSEVHELTQRLAGFRPRSGRCYRSDRAMAHFLSSGFGPN